MRFLIIILFAMTGTLQKCGEGEAGATSHLIDKISLSIHQYPMKEVVTYEIDSTSLRIKLLNKNTGLDSVLLERKGDLKGIQISERDIKKFDKEVYANLCIQDGQVLSLAFLKNDSTIKKIRFSNYYHEDLGRVIDFINSNVDSVYSIRYDKDWLVDEMKKCK